MRIYLSHVYAVGLHTATLVHSLVICCCVPVISTK